MFQQTILRGTRNLSLVFRKFLLLTKAKVLFLVIKFVYNIFSVTMLVRQKIIILLRELSMVNVLMQWSKSDCSSSFIKSKVSVHDALKNQKSP